MSKREVIKGKYSYLLDSNGTAIGRKQVTKQAKVDWVIYIPEEGHWPIKGQHATEQQARAAYLKWAKRKRLPAGSQITQGTF